MSGTVLFTTGARSGQQAFLDLDDEFKRLKSAVERSHQNHNGAFKLAPPVFDATRAQLVESLLTSRPDVVHFGGHGLDRQLKLVDRRGVQRALTEESAVDLFRSAPRRVTLVVLNACNTLSMARKLADEGTVHFAVGTQGKVDDRIALAFVDSFYFYLGMGQPIDNAFKDAVWALELPGNSNSPQLVTARGAAGLTCIIANKPHSPIFGDLRPTNTIARLDGLTRNNLPGWKGQISHALIGREDQLAQLTDAFHDPGCSTVCVIAGGGYGKSSLVTRWLESIRDVPSSGAYANVQMGFAYSFYKQGWEGHSAISSTPFFEECLSALSGEERDQLPKSGGIERWSRDIMSVLSRHRSLLLLDGLEPHQAPLGAEAEGEILDKTLKDFVRGIAMPSGGLCIITSRIMPPELKGPPVESGRVRVIELLTLSFDASVRMLKAAGVRDDHPDLAHWARESHGHPLLLALLAPRIQSGYDPKAFEFHRVLNDIPKTIRNVVVSHLQLLDPAARSVLLAASMFDRPVAYTDLRRLLLDKAVISRLTAPLYTRSPFLRRLVFSERRFVQGIELLEKAAMITRLGSANDPSSWILEPHPIVQAGVCGDLIENDKKAWRKANWTIYRSLVRSVKPKTPDTKEQLAKLYAAIPHGVNAGRGKRAGWMYAKRCLRNFRAYSTTTHGMIGDDVSALSHYFEGNWQTLKEDIGLNPFAQTQALVWSGILLTAVNRWIEGRPLLERGLELAIERHDFTSAARTARHLGLSLAVAGDLKRAEEHVRDSIDLLERRRPLKARAYDWRLVIVPFHRMASRATLGNVLHFQGRFAEAEEAFRDAALQLHRATRFATLRGEWCLREVELMLDQCKFGEAERLIELALVEPEEPEGWTEGIFALPVLRLASVRTRVRCADVLGELRGWDTVADDADAFARIGEDNQLRMDWLVPLVKIALASIARLSNDPEGALRPLDEAEKWVTRSGNRLFEVDVRIEQARVQLALGNREGAKARIRQAEALSDEIGYHCRRAEIERVIGLCN